MKYGVIGATGPTGLEILKQLPHRDTSVYVRSAQKLPPQHELQVTQGSLEDVHRLKTWASSCETIFFALGHGLSLHQIFFNLGFSGYYPQARFMSKAMTHIIDVKPKRIIHCSAHGCRETRQDLPLFFGKVLLPLLIKESYADHEDIETMLEKSTDVEWVVVRPGMLTNGPKTGKYRAEFRFPGEKTLKISRADVAHFMVRCAADNEFLKRCVGLGY